MTATDSTLMDTSGAKRARLSTSACANRAGPRDDAPQGGDEDVGFKVPTLLPKPKKRTLPALQPELTWPLATDELAWLSSAGTDATTTTPVQPSTTALQLNSEESSLIDKLLGKKVEGDLDEDTSKRYFGQDVKPPAQEKRKEAVVDATAELVYDDDADELESFLSTKKKGVRATGSAPPVSSAATAPAAASPSSGAPAAPVPAAAAKASPTSAPHTPSAAIDKAAQSREGADKDKEKEKKKSKANFKF